MVQTPAHHKYEVDWPEIVFGNEVVAGTERERSWTCDPSSLSCKILLVYEIISSMNYRCCMTFHNHYPGLYTTVFFVNVRWWSYMTVPGGMCGKGGRFWYRNGKGRFAGLNFIPLKSTTNGAKAAAPVTVTDAPEHDMAADATPPIELPVMSTTQVDVWADTGVLLNDIAMKKTKITDTNSMLRCI